MMDERITVEEVKWSAGALKDYKSSGKDGLPPEVFKYLSEDMLNPLRDLFEAMYEGGFTATAWDDALARWPTKMGTRTTHTTTGY